MTRIVVLLSASCGARFPDSVRRSNLGFCIHDERGPVKSTRRERRIVWIAK